MPRSPVVVAPDEHRPADGWIIGDAFFFWHGKGTPDILTFVVANIDSHYGPITTLIHGLTPKHPATKENMGPYIEAYLLRVNNDSQVKTGVERIWEAVQEFGKSTLG